MSVVKINAVDVPTDRAGEFEARFAARAGAVEHTDGFEAFELLRPTGGATRYFVYTRWASEDAYQAWLASQDFAKAHAHVATDQSAQEGGAAPVAHGAELLAFEVIERKAAPGQ
ncbi:MAG TPA: antibiotic biosynthesis monooxygenase [Acidimicrobiales bacterium]|nr:antibiotic biosynthesis monooxygenase [Acidimicrobiales bacterium]